MNAGLLEVIAPSRDFYPNMNELKDRFGDTMERVKYVAFSSAFQAMKS